MTRLGQRIKAEKLGFMLDIHYCDTWADPGAQRKPRAWEDLEFPALVEQTRVYSRNARFFVVPPLNDGISTFQLKAHL